MSRSDRPAGGITGAEEVLVVPRGELAAAGLLPEGFQAGGWERCRERIARCGLFVPRSRAEHDPSLKQIIPYAVVTFGERVFLFKRTSGGEARLQGMHSIGVGGHVNPEGGSPERWVEAGLRRELEEELYFERPYRYEALGLVNDDRVPVGRVHLGIVFRVSAGSEQVRVREEEKMEGRFASLCEVEPLLPSMESWSRLVARRIFFDRAMGEGGGP